MWIVEFEKEKELLVNKLKDLIQGIEHIGSTAVPGLAAKPVIDIMIGVNDIQDITEIHKERLNKVGYEFVDHPHFPGVCTGISRKRIQQTHQQPHRGPTDLKVVRRREHKNVIEIPAKDE